MGNFYTNFAISGVPTDVVVEHVEATGRSAVVVPERAGWVVVCPEETELQHRLLMEAMAKELSAALDAVVFAVLNHDDDVLAYWLAKDGGILDRYISDPGALEGREEPPEGGDAEKLCQTFGRPEAVEKVKTILHPPREEDPFAYSAMLRHEALAEALGLPLYTVDLGYTTASMGDLPEGLDEEDLIEV